MRLIILLLVSSFFLSACWDETVSVTTENKDLSLEDETHHISTIREKALLVENLFLRENAIDMAVASVAKNASYGQALARAIKVGLTEDRNTYHGLCSLNQPLIDLANHIIATENISLSRRGLLDQLRNNRWSFSQDLARSFYPSTIVLFGHQEVELPGSFSDQEITASALENFRLLSTNLEKYVASSQGKDLKTFFPTGKIGKFFTVEILGVLAQGLIGNNLVKIYEKNGESIEGYAVGQGQIEKKISFEMFDKNRLKTSFQIGQEYISREQEAAPKQVLLKTEIMFSLDSGSVDGVNRFYQISEPTSSAKEFIEFMWVDDEFLKPKNDAESEQQK